MEKILYWLKKYGKDILTFGLLITCIILIAIKFYLTDSKPTNENSLALNNSPLIEKSEEQEETLLNVDIKGAIKTPGVYQVKSGAIINDVIKLAGGFNDNAYQNGINLSKKVSDEMVIYIYTKNEINAAKEKAEAEEKSNEVCVSPSYNICDCVDNTSSVIETKPNENTSSSKEDAPTTENSKEENSAPTTNIVNINTASIDELTTLNGIGKSKAEAIVKYRTENGKFKQITDLLNISGIGETVFAKIKDFITV